MYVPKYFMYITKIHVESLSHEMSHNKTRCKVRYMYIVYVKLYPHMCSKGTTGASKEVRGK